MLSESGTKLLLAYPRNVKELSRLKYGRDIAVIEAEIAQRARL